MGHVTKPSKATRFNEHTLKKLQKAVALDPEVNLATKLQTDYSARLDSMRNSININNNNNSVAPVRPHEEDIRASLDASAPVKIIYPILKAVLDLIEDISCASGLLSDSFLARLIRIIQASEILWRGPSARCKIVFKCNTYIISKAVQDLIDFTKIVLIFMSYQLGDTLTNVWPTLDKAQKASIQGQLNKILTDLRSLPFTSGTPLGGIGGEGCKDIRRNLRRSDQPITTIDEFEQFLFKGFRSGGDTFVSLMRELCPPASSCRVLFTHGDLRPDNITEYSEFYPEYYEAAKSTNCLSLYEEDDWYLFIPDCVSPKRYALWWLLDCVRETRVV
ncbi:hypothetical protein BJX99DRAFT_246225 [Aspergillus californicus]